VTAFLLVFGYKFIANKSFSSLSSNCNIAASQFGHQKLTRYHILLGDSKNESI